jgi:hypothetical protein
MRRLPLLLILAPFACSNSEEEDDFVVNKTVVQVSPEAFLGDVPCGPEGGMQSYQATLVDVTPADVTLGFDQGFALPHSKVVPCTSALNFEFVRVGHNYIAHVVGFDRSDIEAQNPGSSVVVDENGDSVMPRFTTTCWGRDGEDPPDPSMGGANADDEDLNLGGANALGVTAYTETRVVVRGCEPLVDSGEPGTTAVGFDIQPSLFGQSCGSEAGQVDTFVVSTSSSGIGGAGGTGDQAGSTAEGVCGERLILEGLAPGEHLSFDLFANETGKESPSWQTSCEAFTVEGITVSAGCGPLTEI